MINNLKITNFRQHRNLELTLTSGLNVIRGANEAGKSTVMEAIEYAFYGARALRETLEETVTWGEPATSLRVVLKFTYDGVEGVVSRGKSGAEALYGSTMSSGQNEVTKFFETLFRTSAAMASNLQIASQTKVRGAVEGGGSNAVGLIEKLADFSLIETLIERIQLTRPYGNTSLVSDRINRLTEDSVEVGAQPTKEAVEQAEKLAQETSKQLQDASAALLRLTGGAEAARAQLQAAQRVAEAQDRARARQSVLAGALAAPAPKEPATAAQVAQWREGLQHSANMKELRQAFNVPAPKPANTWEGCREDFLNAAADNSREQTSVAKIKNELITQRQVKLALLVNEGVCSLCKRDISEVPEVVTLNAQLNAEVAALDVQIAELTAKLKLLGEDGAAYAEITAIDCKFDRLFPEKLWKFDMSTMPRGVQWIGPKIEEAGKEQDYAWLIAQNEKDQRAYDKYQGEKLALERELASVQAQLAEPVPEVTGCAEVLAEWEQAKVKRDELVVTNKAAETQVRYAALQYETDVKLYQAEVEQKAKAAAELGSAKQELDQMVFHNELVRKIRGARPAVANKLWASVLSAISHYTTLGRGQPSTVTRDKDGFKINGKAVTAYSGSAQDVLGMAVRLGLVKTFLPNTSFMVMDEIAAACDDNREMDMLGMVMAADIPQVLLVTHSNMAESFANNLVQL